MLKKLNKDSLLIEDLVRVSDVSVECYASRLLWVAFAATSGHDLTPVPVVGVPTTPAPTRLDACSRPTTASVVNTPVIKLLKLFALTFVLAQFTLHSRGVTSPPLFAMPPLWCLNDEACGGACLLSGGVSLETQLPPSRFSHFLVLLFSHLPI